MDPMGHALLEPWKLMWKQKERGMRGTLQGDVTCVAAGQL